MEFMLRLRVLPIALVAAALAISSAMAATHGEREHGHPECSHPAHSGDVPGLSATTRAEVESAPDDNNPFVEWVRLTQPVTCLQHPPSTISTPLFSAQQTYLLTERLRL